ncbi:hypothetical protein [Lysinibacillus pakistanensis]|uniref:Uncharacterized protein n=1 Tax=Lysinibacillus pakistanensis TaxID=759811 RepID=A0ABX6D7Q3_9BACI|nr:hypothetical protein GDS87_01090 [Lysinibacillus pakistanensis]
MEQVNFHNGEMKEAPLIFIQNLIDDHVGFGSKIRVTVKISANWWRTIFKKIKITMFLNDNNYQRGEDEGK